MNKFDDLALLKIEDKDAPQVQVRPVGQRRCAGRWANACLPSAVRSGLERTVTEGILSTKTRQMKGDLYLQTTAQINPGNSGGPLFNLHGEVVGVTNMKITFGEGLGFRHSRSEIGEVFPRSPRCVRVLERQPEQSLSLSGTARAHQTAARRRITAETHSPAPNIP